MSPLRETPRPLAWLTLACTAALAAAAHGQSFTVTAFEDAFVSAANPASNYGGAGLVAIAAANLSKVGFDGLVKFNLAPAKANFDATFGAGLWQIQSISLQFTATPPNNVLFNGFGEGPSATNVNFAGQFAVQWMQNDTWVEGTGSPNSPTTNGVTAATLGSFLGASDEALGTFSFGGGTSGATVAPLALTTAFLADATAGGTVSLRALPADNSIAFVFAGRTNSTAANRPQLAVNATAVPEPGAIALFLAGGLFVASRRRRRPRVADEAQFARRCYPIQLGAGDDQVLVGGPLPAFDPLFPDPTRVNVIFGLVANGGGSANDGRNDIVGQNDGVVVGDLTGFGVINLA